MKIYLIVKDTDFGAEVLSVCLDMETAERRRALLSDPTGYFSQAEIQEFDTDKDCCDEYYLDNGKIRRVDGLKMFEGFVYNNGSHNIKETEYGEDDITTLEIENQCARLDDAWSVRVFAGNKSDAISIAFEFVDLRRREAELEKKHAVYPVL